MKGAPRVAVVAALLVGAGACGDGGGDARPTPADRFDRPLSAALSAALEEHEVHGISAAVAFEDGTTWTGAAGVTSEGGPPVSDETPFRLASVTKTYVAALAMQLVEDGVLALDEPVDLDGVSPRATLRHLLSHRSGLPYEHAGRGPWSEERLGILRPSAVCEPGTCFWYSDLNFIATGILIERATGESLDALLRERLFDPLGLEHTWFASRDLPPGTAAAHGRARNERQAEEWEATYGPRTWASGAMVATAGDLLRWGQALFGGEVVEPASLAEMTAVGGAGVYGLGIDGTHYQGRPALGHEGATGALLLHLVEEGIDLAVVTNRTGFARPVARTVLEALGIEERGDIYVMDVASGRTTRLTGHEALDAAPSWLGDDRVVFASLRDGNAELYVMERDGSGQRRLTRDPAEDRAPEVDDAGRIVFGSDRGGSEDVWVTDPEGADAELLVGTPRVDEAWATPGPGGRLVLELPETGKIAVAERDGSGLTPLDLPGTVGHPSWSPDGSRILYVQFGAGMRTVAADGSDLRVVSTDPFDRFPAWGPDGDIAFVNGFDLWLSDADGGNRRRLTTTPAWEFGASWSPDGTELVFTSDAR